MRKADYALLARIIASERDSAPAPSTPAHTQWVALIERIAHRFADAASVDKTEFLKACGIDL